MEKNMIKYDISRYGFLPEKCIDKLPEKFRFYQLILDNLSENVSNVQYFRSLINDLPKYNDNIYAIDGLTIEERKFMYSILSLICHRYIWCAGNEGIIIDTLPAEIGIPWYVISKSIGIVPVLTHAAVDLYNWNKRDETVEFSLDNIKTNYTMTGTLSESWFYLIMTAIEGTSGEILLKTLSLSEILSKKDNKALIKFLDLLKETLQNNTEIIKRMYEHCDPVVFYNQIRIYLSGSNEKCFANGIGIEGMDIRLKYNGGSAGQSTLIQVYDALLGVKHEGHGKKFLEEQLSYMPKKHRKFLEYVREEINLSEYVKMGEDKRVIGLFNECVNQLKEFRKNHLRLVHDYIVKQLEDESKNKGTGGTVPEKFLSSIIKDNNNALIPSNVNINRIKHRSENTNIYMVMLCVILFYVMVTRWWVWRAI